MFTCRPIFLLFIQSTHSCNRISLNWRFLKQLRGPFSHTSVSDANVNERVVSNGWEVNWLAACRPPSAKLWSQRRHYLVSCYASLALTYGPLLATSLLSRHFNSLSSPVAGRPQLPSHYGHLRRFPIINALSIRPTCWPPVTQVCSFIHEFYFEQILWR